MEDILVVKQIKELCKQKGLSYYKLSQKSNIPYSSLNTMLNHQHIPTISNLIKICNGLDIPVSHFFYIIEQSFKCQNEYTELLTLWHQLDEESKKYAFIYMKGLAHKPLENDNEEF